MSEENNYLANTFTVLTNIFSTRLEYLEKFFPESMKERDKISKDKLEFQKGKNLLKLQEKAIKILKSKNIEPKSIQAKILFPILSNVQLEDNDYLIEKWANLLVNFSDSSLSENILPGFIEILDKLSSIEVIILDKVYEYEKENQNSSLTFLNVLPNEISDNLYFSIIGNLERLNLINMTYGIKTEEKDLHLISLTNFGYLFIKACKE